MYKCVAVIANCTFIIWSQSNIAIFILVLCFRIFDKIFAIAFHICSPSIFVPVIFDAFRYKCTCILQSCFLFAWISFLNWIVKLLNCALICRKGRLDGTVTFQMLAFFICLLCANFPPVFLTEDVPFSGVMGKGADVLAVGDRAIWQKIIRDINSFLSSPQITALLSNVSDLSDFLRSSNVSTTCRENLQFAASNAVSSWSTTCKCRCVESLEFTASSAVSCWWTACKCRCVVSLHFLHKNLTSAILCSSVSIHKSDKALEWIKKFNEMDGWNVANQSACDETTVWSVGCVRSGIELWLTDFKAIRKALLRLYL